MKRDQLKTLSTHTAAKLINCATRSVSAWCDAGLIRCHRLPNLGTQPGARRILPADLLAFLRAHDMPVPRELASTVLAYGSHRPHGCRIVTSPVALGVALATDPPAAVVLSDCDSISALLTMITAIRESHERIPIAAVVGPDVTLVPPDAFVRVFVTPVDAQALAAFVGLDYPKQQDS